MITKLRIDKVFDEREMIYALANAWDITSASFWKNYTSNSWNSLIIDDFNTSDIHGENNVNESSAELLGAQRDLLQLDAGGGGETYYHLTMTMAMEF